MTATSYSDTRFHENTRFGALPATISVQIREPGSALTHFFGLLLFSVGAGPLLLKARETGSLTAYVSLLVYVFSTCLLYTASTVYHTVVGGLRTTTILRKMDHSSISVMIAGTYTPICLTVLADRGGLQLLAAVWTLAIGGVLLKLFWITCPKWISSVLYICMGWLCAFSIKDILQLLPAAAFGWLLAGGIAYSVGAVIYAMHPKEFDAKHIYFGSHEIFHVLIIIGTFCHYLMILRYIAGIY
ncbi:MAG: hemolysin III family protein [Lachnospiraceae bacterium]|nr:hemolysin III family protein [Lachnospiraceae bacterium]